MIRRTDPVIHNDAAKLTDLPKFSKFISKKLPKISHFAGVCRNSHILFYP